MVIEKVLVAIRAGGGGSKEGEKTRGGGKGKDIMVTKKVFGHHKSVVTKNLLVIMQLWQWVAIEKNLVTMQLW